MLRPKTAGAGVGGRIDFSGKQVFQRENFFIFFSPFVIICSSYGLVCMIFKPTVYECSWCNWADCSPFPLPHRRQK